MLKVNDPDNASFKDVIAAFVFIVLTGLTIKIVLAPSDSIFNIVRIWADLAMIVIGGYFGHEIVTKVSGSFSKGSSRECERTTEENKDILSRV